MELGQYQLQIFVSLVVVLGAAFVALICDFLKGNNEQLRELAIELKVRREEEQRRPQTMLPQRVERTRRQDSAPQPTQQSAPLAPLVLPKAPPRESRIPARAVTQAVAKTAESKPAHVTEEKPAAAAASVVTSIVTTTPAKPVVTKAVVTRPVATRPVATRAVATRPVATRTVPSTGAGRKKDWGSLIARSTAARPVELQKDLMDAVVAATNSQREIALPAGFQDGYVLSRLIESRQPVSGLVVSIGVTSPHAASGAMPGAIVELIQSLIRSDEFACQSSDEEFLLVCPGERGASAQRRLSQISQQLWDFQLRSLGKFSILFSWGGIEVRSEAIDEAIASAHERMSETRRGRKLLMMEPREEMALRQAV